MTQVGFKVHACVLIRGTQKRDMKKRMPPDHRGRGCRQAAPAQEPLEPWTLDEAKQASPQELSGSVAPSTT